MNYKSNIFNQFTKSYYFLKYNKKTKSNYNIIRSLLIFVFFKRLNDQVSKPRNNNIMFTR